STMSPVRSMTISSSSTSWPVWSLMSASAADATISRDGSGANSGSDANANSIAGSGGAITESAVGRATYSAAAVGIGSNTNGSCAAISSTGTCAAIAGGASKVSYAGATVSYAGASTAS